MQSRNRAKPRGLSKSQTIMEMAKYFDELLNRLKIYKNQTSWVRGVDFLLPSLTS